MLLCHLRSFTIPVVLCRHCRATFCRRGVHGLIHTPLNHSRNDSLPQRFTSETIHSRNESLPQRITAATNHCRIKHCRIKHCTV